MRAASSTWSTMSTKKSRNQVTTRRKIKQSTSSCMINREVIVVLKIITGFYVSDEAVELLRNVKEKIGVIAVAGKYRTGKSFLLNRIILNKTDNNGFGVGPTINPCTKVRILYIYSGRDCGFGISR